MMPRLLGLSLLMLCCAVPAQAVILSWDYPTGGAPHDGFLVSRKIQGGTYTQVGQLTNPAARTYTDPVMPTAQSTSYCWQVQAYNADGVSLPSNEVCRSVQVPAAPTNLRFGP